MTRWQRGFGWHPLLVWEMLQYTHTFQPHTHTHTHMQEKTGSSALPVHECVYCVWGMLSLFWKAASVFTWVSLYHLTTAHDAIWLCPTCMSSPLVPASSPWTWRSVFFDLPTGIFHLRIFNIFTQLSSSSLYIRLNQHNPSENCSISLWLYFLRPLCNVTIYKKYMIVLFFMCSVLLIMWGIGGGCTYMLVCLSMHIWQLISCPQVHQIQLPSHMNIHGWLGCWEAGKGCQWVSFNCFPPSLPPFKQREKERELK